MSEASTCTPRGGEVQPRNLQAAEDCSEWVIEEGDLADYRNLSVFHYRAGPPTCVSKVLRLVYRGDAARSMRMLAGVLLVSYPALWCSWHRRAWPERFARFPRGRFGSVTSADGLNEAQRLNRSLRMISRVVIDPRFRGLGGAASLVRAYLANPQTPLTAALASMGRCCPFFAAAGMTPHELPPSARDAELAEVFASWSIKPWKLVDEAYAEKVVKDRRILRALRAWHEAGGRARHRRKVFKLVELAMHAGAVLYARPVVYTHGT